MAQSEVSHPICPTCGSDFVKNKQAPGRLICRRCNVSFDEKLIMAYWHGTGYSQAVRSNEHYTAASNGSLPQLTGQLREEVLDGSFTEDDDYEYFFDPNASAFDPLSDDLDDIIEYEFYETDFEPKENQKTIDDSKEGSKAYGPFAVLSAVVGLVCLIVSLIPIIGLVSVIPAVLGMMVGRLSWSKLEPGSPAYAAAIFGTIACAIAVVTAIIAAVCGENIIGFLNTTFPELFQSAK